jgi:cytoskeletal protein CcmA (bactofilin family)
LVNKIVVSNFDNEELEMLGMDKNKSRANTNSVETLIGPRVVIRGDVTFSGGLYIEGKVIGKVIAEEGGNGVLTVAEQGSIEGEVHAPVVIVSGHIKGEVHADERIELTTTARVNGNLNYKVVEMAAGATLNGRLIHADAPLSERQPAAAA